MDLKAIAKGALSLHPDLYARFAARPRPPSAEYCYGVWIKHLVLAHQSGWTSVPETVAELGPGSTVGVGLAALLSGVRHYVGLDVVRHTEVVHNLSLLDELVVLFERRTPAPGDGWPGLASSAGRFPAHILSEPRLAMALAPARLEAIRRILRGEPPDGGDVSLDYVAPWSRDSVPSRSIDFLLSHCVLEYVPDVRELFVAARSWLRPGGIMSHQVDLGAHLLARRWYGNWVYPPWLWVVVSGGRPFRLNLLPASTYLRAVHETGFAFTRVLERHTSKRPEPAQLAPAWRALMASDRDCVELFLQARMPD